MVPFGDRLAEAIRRTGTPLCVGLDPRSGFLPKKIVDATPNVTEALRVFSREVIDVAAGVVPVIKVQVAFYERFGAEGMRAFEDVLRYGREQGLMMIGDVKRGDIGSTAKAYAEAYLGEDAPFAVDAITVSPYFGEDGLRPFVEEAVEFGRGVFVVVRSSNPTSDFVQSFGREPLYDRLAKLVLELGRGTAGASGYTSVGAVVATTLKGELKKVRRMLPRAFFLVPGYGAQGATAEDVAAAFNPDGTGALINSARAIIHSYGDSEQARWREMICSAMEKAMEEIELWRPSSRESK